MKKTILYLLAAVLIGCSERNTPIVVDFQMERTSNPLIVHFTNLSVGATDFRWDFGDGTWTNSKDTYKGYDKTGTYIVTLTATVDGYKYDCRKTITISEPKVYIAGYTLYHIPYENRYYKVVFKDDNLLPSSWDFKTVYTPLLDANDLPYTTIWTVPKQMIDIDTHSYYTVEVIRSTNTSSTSNDVSCMKQKLTVKNIKTYQPEYVLQTDAGTTAIGIIMEYVY